MEITNEPQMTSANLHIAILRMQSCYLSSSKKLS